MPSKKVQRVVNPRKLTAVEAAEARQVRESVENDKDGNLVKGRKFQAEKRQRSLPPENHPGSMLKPSSLKRLALLMSVNCVRNTVIENYHAAGKIDDSEMKAFNQEVANKIYTFLQFLLLEPDEDRDAFLSAMAMMYPKNWDQPNVDRDFMETVKIAKRMAKRFNQNDGDKA
jgi:hypothetical protein